jgi:hypothetical protein
MCHVCNKVYSLGSTLSKHLKTTHNFEWPSGHSRFRYKLEEDGYYRLQTLRYESIELFELLNKEEIKNKHNTQSTLQETNTSLSLNADSNLNTQNISNSIEYLESMASTNSLNYDLINTVDSTSHSVSGNFNNNSSYNSTININNNIDNKIKNSINIDMDVNNDQQNQFYLNTNHNLTNGDCENNDENMEGDESQGRERTSLFQKCQNLFDDDTDAFNNSNTQTNDLNNQSFLTNLETPQKQNAVPLATGRSFLNLAEQSEQLHQLQQQKRFEFDLENFFYN